MDGTLAFCKRELRKMREPRYALDVARKHKILLETYQPILQNHVQELERLIQVNNSDGKQLRSALGEWQFLYRNVKRYPMISCHIVARPTVRMTVSAVMGGDNGSAVVTILPKPPKDSCLCDIVVSCIPSPGLLSLGGHRKRAYVKKQAELIADALTSEPAIGLTTLLKSLSLNHTSYFFISPDDYKNDSIVGPGQRTQIEREIASIITARFGDFP